MDRSAKVASRVRWIAAGLLAASTAAGCASTQVPRGSTAAGTGANHTTAVQPSKASPGAVAGSPTSTTPQPSIAAYSASATATNTATCHHGTVSITHAVGDPGQQSICITNGATLDITLVNDGLDWAAPSIRPSAAAAIVSTKRAHGRVRTLIVPRTAAPFTVHAYTATDDPTGVVAVWSLRVAVHS